MIAEGDMIAQRGFYVIDLKEGKVGYLKEVTEKGEFILEEIR